MEGHNNLKKRLYQNLLNKPPKQNHLLGSDVHTKSAILKPKIHQEMLNTTAKIKSPAFQKGKLRIQSHMKSPEIPKKIAPLASKQKISKQGKAIIQQGKLKSKANLKPHDIFAFYEAFPEMIEDFFYLNRISHPYDYQIVTYSQRNSLEYMTISSKGVTLYHEKQAEFMTKDEWLADQKVYYSLQRIQFFKQYKISKNFTIWKNRMKRHYMKQMSNMLSNNLFFSFEHPRNCLVQIRRITNSLKQSTYFMPSDTIQSMDAGLFLQNSLNFLDKSFMMKIKQVEDMIADELQKAINQEIKKFKLENNIKIHDVGDHDQKQHKQGYVYSQQAILRKQYKKVHKLIKLADNILLESKIQLVHNCILQLLQKITQARDEDSKEQWINCTAFAVGQEQYIKTSNQNRILWNPTMDGLKDIFKTIINQTVAKINEKYQKIGSRQKFQKFRNNDQNDNRKDEKKNTLKYMIQDSAFFSPLIKKIEFYLEQEFKRTKLEESELIKFINIYSKHKSLTSIKQIFAKNTAAECCQLVREWKQHNQDMQLLPDNKSAGLLVFNYSQLRKKMISAPSQTLSSFLAYLPQETSSRCRQLLHQSKLLLQMINIYPADISSFVTFNKAVRIASQKLESLMQGSNEVVLMVGLIEQNKLANIDIYKGRSKQVRTSAKNLKLKVDQSNAKYDQSLSKFRKQLQSNTSRVKSTVKQLMSKFQIISFDKISSQIIQTLQKLEQILPSIEQIYAETVQIQQIQTQLSLPLTQLSQIHLLYNKSKVINQLWQCKKQWNELLIEIYNKHYKEINCEQIREKWEDFSVKNHKLQKSIPDNQVLKMLIVQISQFQNLLQTISALTSPNLEDKSWREISQYLAYELNIQDQKSLPFSNRDDPEYTVEWLINNNISLYKQKITFIVQKSQKQKQLQTSLGQFKIFISSIVFETVVKKTQVALIQINEVFKQNLKQKISILYSLIGNQYSDVLKNQAEVMIKHYEYMEQILSGLYTFRQEWQKYEIFFENNAVSSKLLTKESKQFISWELQWKKIIKSITNDPAYFYKKICDQTMGVNCSRAIIKTMNKANMFLDLVKKGMEQFLQKKRLQFPRYCLLTDGQLISILSKLDSQNSISQQVVDILYDNIRSIQYDEQAGTISSVTTKDCQKFFLLKQATFKSQSQMQDLLKTTQEHIKKAMAHYIRNSFNRYIDQEISREQILKENILQVPLLVDYIAWVRLAEQTYLVSQPVGTMQDWLNIQQQQTKQIANLMKKCPQSEYFKHVQFMVQSIYFREKTISLAKNNIKDTESYEWQRIPKMIMTNSQIFLKQLQSRVFYNYELLNQKDAVVIQAQTERAWVTLTNAISNKSVIGLRNSQAQSIRDLAFYVGQSMKSIQLSEHSNIKTVERLLTGYMYLGCWMHFLPIKNSEILSYISYHISSSKRANNFESTSSALQLTKSTMFTNALSNTIFLFQAGQTLVETNLIDSKNFRNVSIQKPDERHIMSVLCSAQNIPKEIGTKLVNLCDFCRETFSFAKSITFECQKQLLKQIKLQFLPKFSSDQLADSQVLDFITVRAVQQKFANHFSDADVQLFQNFKLSLIPNYLILRAKHNYRFPKVSSEDHMVMRYANLTAGQNSFTKEFINQAIKVYDSLMHNDKFGLVVSGQILSGKSQIINFVEKVYRYAQGFDWKSNNDFKVFKLYPNSYKFSDVINSNVQQIKEKKQKVQKSQKSQKQKVQKLNQQLGILQAFLTSDAKLKWIILDGKIDKQLIQLTKNHFDNLLVPNYGLISKQKGNKSSLQKVKIIIQNLSLTEFSPALFYNYNVCHLMPNIITVQSLVSQLFLSQKTKKHLNSLTSESILLMKTQLISNLSKIQQKGDIKSKYLKFLYPFAENQITLKCLRLMECVFKMNQESIREKQKDMKKTIEKFIYWSILIVLYLHVDVENQTKLQKKFMQIFKCENFFTDSIIRYIVYPSSGIQVHPVNGLRTQSSIFQIPERGIITLIPKNDYNDFNNSMNQNNNKFYQEISLEDISGVRVNHDQSNIFSYYSQLFAYSNIPLVIYGPVGSGKKSTLELYAKNIRQRAFVHSIRHHKSKSLMEVYQKPFRKYNSLSGVMLKSYSVNKSIVVFVQDLNMIKQENQSLQFLRMLINDGKFINKNGQIRKLTEQNNSLSILSTRLNVDQNVLRLSARIMFFQTAKLSGEKISSIFLPYLKAWGKANSLQGEVQRIFCSQNGDNLLDATIKVFQSMDQMFKVKKSKNNFSLQTILLRPRLGDISKVLAFICRTSNARKYSISYYSQLWANEILRVFDDRLSPKQTDFSLNLMELIKKQFFLKFKQNFLYTSKDSLMFTNILSEQNTSYERIEEMQNLQQLIINQIQSETITVPVKLFFNELLRQIMKIYRVIQIDNGHIIIFNLNKKVRQYLIQLACQVAESNFISLKQKVISVQKDILQTVDLDQNVIIFEDIDDITTEQVYQLTCLLNKNCYDYELKPDTKQKVKNRLSKYMRNNFNQVSAAKQNYSNLAKSKNQGLKQKQNLYLNLKLQDQLESTMQEIFMSNVHFILGASPSNEKTRNLILNQTDLMGQMHFSFFQIPEESLMHLTKQILIMQEEPQSEIQSEEIIKTDQYKKLKQQAAQRIQTNCTSIYKSLEQSEQNFNELLCICENIVNEKEKLETQSNLKVKEWQKCIQKHSKAIQLIGQNQQKLKVNQNQLQIIKKQQAILSQKLQQKGNEINELQLNVPESTQVSQQSSDQLQRSEKLKQKNEQFENIQNELREIKMKKDKNDIEAREARKIIQISKDFLQIIQDVEIIQKKLLLQKNIQQNIESLLILWWSLMTYQGNRMVVEIIDDVNKWANLIGFKYQKAIQKAQDLLQMFEVITRPLEYNIPGWESFSAQIRLKGIMFIYTLMHQEFTTSFNRIITLYDPSKVYSVLFQYLNPDSELGDYTLGKILDHFDEQTWSQIEKVKKGLIFLEDKIQSRQKKEIQKAILQRRYLQLNKFVSLVNIQQKADFSFHFEKQHYVNYLKFFSLSLNDQHSISLLSQVRDQNIKQTKKFKELQSSFRTKCASIDFDPQNDTEQINKIKREMNDLEPRILAQKQKLKMHNIRVKDQEIIQKLVKEVYKYKYTQSENAQNICLETMNKVYTIVSDKVRKFALEIRENIKNNKTPSKTKIFDEYAKMPSDRVLSLNAQPLTPSLKQMMSSISQALQQQHYSLQDHLLYSCEQMQLINEFIEQIIFNNFNPNKKIRGDDIFSLSICSYQFRQKVPIVVVSNNLPNYAFISRQNRPINLLYNSLSNVLVESSNISDQKSHTINNKIFLFYNDNIHHYSLIELVNKYSQEYIASKGDNKHCIFLFTNSPLSLLANSQQTQPSNYQLFYYQKNHQNQLQTSLSAKTLTKQRLINDKSSKTQLYIKLVQILSSKRFYNNLSEIQRYTQSLQSVNSAITPQDQGNKIKLKEIERYWLDICDKVQNEEQIAEKILSGQITHDHINHLLENLQNFQDQPQSKIQEDLFTDSNFEPKQYTTKAEIQQIQEELPNIFNTAEFIQLPSKDSLCCQIQTLAKNFNKKLKKIKHILDQNLKQHDLTLNKLPNCQYSPKEKSHHFIVPSNTYILKLNKEYKTLRKLLTQSGMLVGLSSMSKIASYKGIGNSLNSQTSLFLKNCISMDDFYFNKRIQNQLKVRISKKLKIPFNRVGFMWVIIRKGQNSLNPTYEKLINSLPPDITMSVMATMQNCQIRHSSSNAKEKKDSHRLLTMIKNIQQRFFKLLMIPYDLNALPEISCYTPVPEIISLGIKKKTICEMGVKKQENNKQKIEMLKIKVVFKSFDNQQQQLGYAEIPSNQIDCQNIEICMPKIVILHTEL